MSALLRFANDPDCQDLVHEVTWLGSWPAPEAMFLVVGITTGYIVVGDRDAVEKMQRESPDWAEHIVIQEFRRVKASIISDEEMEVMADMVVRGAVYTPVFKESL